MSEARRPRLTVDVIVERPGGAVVLVRRKNPPHGWALPGGFVDWGETVETAARRELAEETGLEVLDVSQFHVYSDPARDPRGHTVSVVFTAQTDGPLRAGDDAAEAAEFSFDRLPPDIVFDHRAILDDWFARRFR